MTTEKRETAAEQVAQALDLEQQEERAEQDEQLQKEFRATNRIIKALTEPSHPDGSQN